MTSFEESSHAYILRFWREPREIQDAEPEWRGVIEHVRTGDRRYLRGLDGILDFIAWHLGNTTSGVEPNRVSGSGLGP